MKEIPEIIHGGEHMDVRGNLCFFNEFDFSSVKRFYIIKQPDITVIRAWQGHKIEEKWFCVVEGSFIVVLLRPDNWIDPSSRADTSEFVLKSTDPKVLYVPGNYANGFKALEPNSKIIIFSSFSVEESANDNYRFDKNKWYDWNKW